LAPLAGTGLAIVAALAPIELAAQTVASLDAGASHVEYDGFLPSAAFSLTPSLRHVGRRLAFGARAAWLQFESGNSSVQGSVAGSVVLTASRGAVAELGAELGASRYEDFARFSHLLATARIQFPGVDGEGGWVLATIGTVANESERRMVQRLAGALRFDRPLVSVTLSGTGTQVGGTSYVDLGAGVRHVHRGRIEAEAVVSARAGDPASDGGPYLEAALTLPLFASAALVLAGGRYAADAVRGNVAGRYVTAAVRVTAARRRQPLPRAALPPAIPPAGDGAAVAATLIETRRGRGEACTLIVHAAGATTVEVMADFTDWLTTALEPAGRDLWRATLRIPPGRYRLNLRVNGGPWGVPAGTTPISDEFQGTVGAIVIP
jgi:hypothetical protein